MLSVNGTPVPATSWSTAQAESSPSASMWRAAATTSTGAPSRSHMVGRNTPIFGAAITDSFARADPVQPLDHRRRFPPLLMRRISPATLPPPQARRYPRPMAEARRYTVEELERMSPTERRQLRDELPTSMGIDDLSEPFRSKVQATIDRIDEIRPRRPEG